MSNGNITNYSKLENRKTDLTIGVSYDTNLKKAKDLIYEIIAKNPKILQEPKPSVSVKELTDSGIKIAIRVWTKNEDFVDVCSDLLEYSKTAFDTEDIVFQPFVKEAVK